MLGRLRMSTQEALAQYSTLAGRIFSKENKQSGTKDGKFKASTLEAEVKKLVEARKTSTTRMLDPDAESMVGKSYDCQSSLWLNFLADIAGLCVRCQP